MVGFQRFQKHVEDDAPQGIIPLPQFTGTKTKVDAFQKRYPGGELSSRCGGFSFSDEYYLAQEKAFLVRPSEYLQWLLEESKKNLDLEVVEDFVTEFRPGELLTLSGRTFKMDHVVLTAGVQNLNWLPCFKAETVSRAVQGSYLEFTGVSFPESFSLTLEGDNLIYDKDRETLLVGSTTFETSLELPPLKNLREIHQRLEEKVDLTLPDFEMGEICVGLREKGRKREPYILQEGNRSAIGGLYKNGYSLSLSLGEKLLERIS